MRSFRVAAMIVAVAASAVGGVGARPITVPRPRAFAARLLAPSAGDVSYGLAQVRIVGRSRVPRAPVAAGQVAYAGRVGGLAVTVRSPDWSALRASTRVYLIVSKVAGQDDSARNLALFVVRRRINGGPRRRLRGRAEFDFSVANATPALGSFWVRGVDRDGFSRIFAVRDLLTTAVANWGRYLSVLRAADALAAAAHPLEPTPSAHAARERSPRRPSVWTGGQRPSRRERAIFRLLVDALANPLEYAAAKRNPLISGFIAHDLNNSRLARRWRAVTAQLPLHVPDRYAAAAQEEAEFTHVRAPRITHFRVAIDDTVNSSSEAAAQLLNPLRLTVDFVVDDLQSGPVGRVVGRANAYGQNLDCPSDSEDCGASFATGSVWESLSAVAYPGEVFAGWVGCDHVDAAGVCSVFISNHAARVTAKFRGGQPSLAVSLIGNGQGMVTSNPAGINCGSTCAWSFPIGQQVTLSAFPNPDASFGGWSGCPDPSGYTCTVTIGSVPTHIAATFNPYALQLTVDLAGPPGAGGEITSDPPAIACPSACSATFPSGTLVTLTAVADANSTFGGWSGCDIQSGTSCQVAVEIGLATTRTVTATFLPSVGRISRIAGDGSACHSAPDCGDNGHATAAELAFPSGVAADAMGNVYLADTSNQEIRKIAPDGTITRVAGTGTICFTAGCGDGGSALSAQFDNPQGVAVDAAGDVYIADTDDETVRKVAPDGTITRVAGIHGDLCTTAPACGDGGPATSARLDQPLGIAVDSGGNLYIADAGDNEIRKVTTNGTITRFAGTGMPCTSAPDCGDGLSATLAALNTPGGLAVDGTGNVFIADTGDNEVRVVTTDGKMARFAGTGRRCTTAPDCGDGANADNGALNGPGGVAVDPMGTVYIADTGDNEVRVASRFSGHLLTRFAGNGTQCTTAPACGDGGPAIEAQLKFPSSVAVDPFGGIDIADTQDYEVRQVVP